MRETIWKFMACLMVISQVMVGDAAAGERTASRKMKGDRPGHDTAYSLLDIMEKPREYLERDVLFYARFATTANLFKTVNTRFNSTHHVNFAVWPDRELLWEAEGRKNVLPTLYIAKNDPDNLAVLREVEKYQVVAITGRVLNVYAGYPWVIVTNMEVIEKPNERLCDQMIEHMQSGHEALKAGHGGAAARHFEQAMQFGMPMEFRAKAYEQLAQAYLLENRLDRARDYLREAVAAERNDPILHLALADTALRMGDAGEALAHCQFALERSGRYPQVYGIRAEAHSLLGDYAQAFSDLNTAAGTPGITPREKAMVSVRRARIYARSDRYPDAARVYAAASEPGEPLSGESWLHNEIGLFYEKLFLESDDERYLDSAYTAFEEAARTNRLDPSVLYNMAEVEFRRQRLSDEPAFEKVMDIIRRVYELEPDYAPARILEGRILFIEEKFEEAEYRYQSVSSQIGNDPTAMLALAEAYMDLARYDEAADTVARARALQPWNTRVQALGDFLEAVASQLAMMQDQRQRSYGDYRLNKSEESYGEPYYEEVYEEPEAEGETVGGRFFRRGRSSTRSADQAARQESRPARSGRQAAKQQPAGGERMRPEGVPAPAQAVAAGNEPLYRGYGRPRQGYWMGTGGGHANASAEQTRPGSSYYYPQDIQASVRPAMPTGNRWGRLPRTRVRLPENEEPRARADEMVEEYQEEYPEERAIERRPAARDIEPLDLGFTPGDGRAVRDLDRPERRETHFREDFGRDYDWREGMEYDRQEGARGYERYEGEREYDRYEREADYDDEGYLRFGMIEGVTGAYASIPVGSMEEKLPSQGEMARIPPPFSFRQDEAPVILANVRSTGSTREMPVRNANVYRRLQAGTRPAEIIERDAIAARLPADVQVMTPPRGGAYGENGLHRAEVRLPSSSLGVGMASDVVAGR